MKDAGPALLELARVYGVMTSYEERPGGPVHHATVEALVGVLAALGAPVREPSDASEAIRARTRDASSLLLEPVTVVWSGRPDGSRRPRASVSRAAPSPAAPAVPLRLATPLASLGASLDVRLVLESGETIEWREGAPSDAPALRPPRPLPHGYHRLTVRAGSREGSTWLVCAPESTWEPHPAGRRAGNGARAQPARAELAGDGDVGVFIPLYALRTSRSWGTADVTDLAALLRWSGGHGARFVGTLPLTATFLGGGRAPVDPGPYVPVSRLFWNELYLDVEHAPGLDRAPDAQRLLGSSSFREEVERLRAGRRVRYRESMALKRRVIDALAAAVAPPEGPLAGPLAGFAARHPEALPYARFRAAVERLGARWRTWSEADARDAGSADDDAVRCHLYAQWAMELQMSAFSAADGGGLPELYLDLPLGAHPDGFDVWRFRDDFAHGLSGGAPPDPFQREGQDWGFPPLHPEHARGNGHAYLRRCLSHLMRASGMLRLDHVMSLHRLYCIPAGHSPLDGAYVRYPAEELYAVLCVESNRWRCQVVGEDLGTVPPEVRDEMARRRLRRMYVLPFELEAPGPPDAPGTPPRPAVPAPPPRLAPAHPLSVASLGTHDLPPFAAFTTGLDIDRRLAEGMITGEAAAEQHAERARWFAALKDVVGASPEAGPVDVHPLALWLLAASPSEHVLVNLEDLWGETESQNAPGTLSDENWTLRAPYPLEEWDARLGAREFFHSLIRERHVALRRGETPRGARPRTGRPKARGKEWPK